VVHLHDEAAAAAADVAADNIIRASVCCSPYILTGNSEVRMRFQNDLPVMHGHAVTSSRADLCI